MKVKASVVLAAALELIKSGKQSFACAAIQDVETQMRLDADGENIISKAQSIFNTFKPERIKSNASIVEWWPTGSPERIEALEQAIKLAKQRND
jgi:hypothetical protein